MNNTTELSRRLVALSFGRSIIWTLGMLSSLSCTIVVIAGLVGASSVWTWLIPLLATDLALTLIYNEFRKEINRLLKTVLTEKED